MAVNDILENNSGVFVYVLEGGPIRLNVHRIVHLGAVRVIEESGVNIQAEWDTELLLVDVLLIETEIYYDWKMEPRLFHCL